VKLFLALALITITARAQNYTLQTVAGHSISQEAVPATENYIRAPGGVVADSLGNIFFSDTQDNRVWKIDTTGKATTYAGNGVAFYESKDDGGPANTAYLYAPTALAIDGANNLYICDLGNYRVRKVTPQGIISTVAGNGNSTSSGDNGPATSAGMFVNGIAADKAGNLYIRDGNKVRKVSAATQIITTFAGNGTSGYSGDGGQASSAELKSITGIAPDQSGNVYIGDDLACNIRKVSANNIITTVYGTGTCGTPAGDGGQASAAVLDPNAMAFDAAAANLYFSETNAYTVREINLSSGKISTIAGTAGKNSFSGDGGPATSATFNLVVGVSLDSAGNVYISDYFNHRIRKITASNNNINTIAGTSVNDGPAISAFLDHPVGIAFDPTGKLNIADTGDSLIRQFNPAAAIISSVSPIDSPEGIAVDSNGNLYLSSYDWKIYQITPAGKISVWAGNGTYGSADGSASSGTISEVTGIAVDSAGNLYLADYRNNLVRKVDTSHNITTIAGTAGKPAYTGEGGPASKATLTPYDIAIDKTGNLYVADLVNARVLKFAPGGNISTVAGTGTAGNSGDGGQATQANIDPTGIALDAAGDVYIGTGVLRKVNTAGVIQTIAGGSAIYPFNGDGPALMQNVDAFRMAIDSTGTIYICDYANDRIRKLIAVNPASVTIVSGNNQTGAAGTALTQPLVVKVIGSDGNAYAGATVTFSAANNTASFNPASALTVADGTASTVVTLGSTVGTVNVVVTVAGVAPVAFSETATAAAPLPTIAAGGVVSAGLSSPTIQTASPNAILSIFGQNFAPAGTSRKVSGGDLVNGLVPTNLIGVCVLFGAQRAPVFLVTPGQLNVQAPQLPASGTVTVQVITNCDTANQVMSNTVNVAVQAAAPEFFYAASNASGQNPVAATDGVTLGGVGDPARLGGGFALGYPGEVVVIYATGLGSSTPSYGAGALPPVASPVSNVTVSIDGAPVDPSLIQYAGVTPLLAGVYQLNLQLPQGLAPGDHSITISVNGASSPSGPYISTGPAM
jgi:uncharacterized protein (TIGR03437 family)